MRLPNDYDDSRKLTPTVISTIAAVTLFVAAILVIVLVLNRSQFQTRGRSNAVVQQSARTETSEQVQSANTEGDGRLSGNTLTPDDFTFWDLYPEKPEEGYSASSDHSGESQSGSSEETLDIDPSTDGRHTRIQYANGEEEWVLISPYLPKHGYDFTRLVCQDNLMKYYVDGKQVSFVGADISKYHDYVDFIKLRKAGVDFVILRAGARGYGSGQLVLDDNFSDNLKRATDAGLEIGVYFFSQAISADEAIEEANMVLDNLGDYQISYPIAFEMGYVENDTARVERLSRSEKTIIAKTFLDTVKNAGYTPMIYGNKEWLIKHIDMTRLASYDVWLSQSEDIPDYPYKFSMWQYTNSASIDGIAGMANLNISFIDYSEK